MKKIYFLLFASLFLSRISEGQYSNLLSFNITNGSNPYGSLIISGNILYGMTNLGGAHDSGCIFTMHTDGSGYIDLLDFNGVNGSQPQGTLALFGKRLFGMTEYGGSNHEGCIFSLDTTGGGYKDLHDFNGTSGKWPYGLLVLSGKRVFGMAYQGGANNDGCIFSIDTTGGGYKDIFDFSGAANGAGPHGSLTPYSNKLYGMAASGGANGYGCIFNIDTSGNGYKDLFDFNLTNGAYPVADLTISGNTMYGMTYYGGTYNGGSIFSIDTSGSGFTNLYNLQTTGINSYYPYGSLTLAGNTLYGMACHGGLHIVGEIFSININGSGFTDLLDFGGGSSTGASPNGSFTRSGTVLYGMTEQGGVNGDGNVFSFKDITLGTNELPGIDETIKIYPNPSNGLLTVHISATDMHQTVEIYNILGEKVSTVKLFSANTNINMSTSPSGMYFYKVITETGSSVSEGKFILQR